MKKLIIIGFFALIAFVTVGSAVLVSANTGERTEVKFRITREDLSDARAEQVTKRNIPPIPFDINRRYYLEHHTKEIRTKGFFGWTSQVDTLVTYIENEEN